MISRFVAGRTFTTTGPSPGAKTRRCTDRHAASSATKRGWFRIAACISAIIASTFASAFASDPPPTVIAGRCASVAASTAASGSSALSSLSGILTSVVPAWHGSAGRGTCRPPG